MVYLSIMQREKHETRLSTLIATRRQQQKLSQRDLARLTGLSSPYICQIESGHVHDPSFSRIVKIAAALKLNLKKLVDAVQ